MKKKILASVLMAIILSGCTMPEISFNNTDSPLFVEEKNESSASDVTASVGSEQDTSENESDGGTKEKDTSSDRSGTDMRNEDTSADQSLTGMEGDDSLTDLSGDTSVKDKEKKDSERIRNSKTENAELLSVVLSEKFERKYDSTSGKVSAKVDYAWPKLTAAAKTCKTALPTVIHFSPQICYTSRQEAIHVCSCRTGAAPETCPKPVR